MRYCHALEGTFPWEEKGYSPEFYVAQGRKAMNKQLRRYPEREQLRTTYTAP